jgi:hypothetical protein
MVHRWLASRAFRLGVIAWIIYSVHFATNVVREHYPAFALAEHGTFRVDEYQGFHSDIFVHRDGHSVIGNQVLVSALAAIPLLVFDPVLDALEAHRLRQIADQGVTSAEYRTDKPMRVEFFRLVRERGLDLRFGAATAVTVVFFMAPLTAVFLALFYKLLRWRGLTPEDSTGLTLLLAFGTPIFFRTTGLNHNMFVLYFSFASFALLWWGRGTDGAVPLGSRVLAGLAAGLVIATDYIGVIMAPVLYGYLVIPRKVSSNWATAIREAWPFVLGSAPALAFLFYSQWAMYGNPFLPGQYWMPDQNIYTNEGMRGFTLPDVELFFQNLFHPGFGIYTWGPILALALVPASRYPSGSLILPRRERWFVIAMYAAILLFCSTNQYARLQWNSGFRYLVPLVPLLVLALADHWSRLPRWARGALLSAAIVHAWVLTVFREPVPRSWELFLAQGIQLPWYRVFSMTAPPDSALAGRWWIAALILGVSMLAAWAVWSVGARAERRLHLQAVDEHA